MKDKHSKVKYIQTIETLIDAFMIYVKIFLQQFPNLELITYTHVHMYVLKRFLAF